MNDLNESTCPKCKHKWNPFPLSAGSGHQCPACGFSFGYMAMPEGETIYGYDENGKAILVKETDTGYLVIEGFERSRITYLDKAVISFKRWDRKLPDDEFGRVIRGEPDAPKPDFSIDLKKK